MFILLAGPTATSATGETRPNAQHNAQKSTYDGRCIYGDAFKTCNRKTTATAATATGTPAFVSEIVGKQGS